MNSRQVALFGFGEGRYGVLITIKTIYKKSQYLEIKKIPRNCNFGKILKLARNGNSTLLQAEISARVLEHANTLSV
jgi:hypothetical protein